MEGVLTRVAEAARAAGAVRVTRIRLVVGEMSEVVPDAMEFALEALAAGTLAEGATLEIERVQPCSRCTQCGHVFEHDRFTWICPACDGLGTELLAGRELYIKDIEVEHGEHIEHGEHGEHGTSREG